MIVTMPGKLGDALYSLPTIKLLSEIRGEKITFWTSPYCKPLKTLFEAQRCVKDVFIDNQYAYQHDNLGMQPWRMQNAELVGQEVIHLGFRGYPPCSLPLYMLRLAGFDTSEQKVEASMVLDYTITRKIEGDYIVLAPKTLNPQFEELWRALTTEYKVVSIGTEYFPGTIDMTGLDFLETCAIIDNAKLYAGTLSAMLALANFFNVPKIVPYDQRWDLTHGLNKPEYLMLPSVDVFMKYVRMRLS
jgi:hypothetical protein